MNRAIEIKKELENLYRVMNDARVKFENAKYHVEEAESKLGRICNHKNEDGTSAIRPSSNRMYDDWGTCQICNKYMEY